MTGPAMYERDVLRACLDLLKARGIFCWRQNSGATKVDGRNGKTRFVRWATSGVADIIAVLPPNGRMLCIEVKRPDGGRLSEEQASFLDAVRRYGAAATVISDVADLDELLNRLLPEAA